MPVLFALVVASLVSVSLEPQVLTYQAPPLILDQYSELERIADCESGLRDRKGKPIKGSATHYTKNGEVLVNESDDVGFFQINLHFWKKKAEELGFDLSTERGNKEFGEWLYEEEGNKPWYLSKSCWKL